MTEDRDPLEPPPRPPMKPADGVIVLALLVGSAASVITAGLNAWDWFTGGTVVQTQHGAASDMRQQAHDHGTTCLVSDRADVTAAQRPTSAGD